MEKKLRHFETTNKVHRWTPPAPPPPSTIATRAPTLRSAYGAGTQQQQARGRSCGLAFCAPPC